MMRGSSSTGRFLAAIEVLGCPVLDGTLILLKSKLAKPVGKAAKEWNGFYIYYIKKVPLNLTQKSKISRLTCHVIVFSH